MTNPLTFPLRFDPRTVADLQAVLAETFDAEFQIWSRADDWHCLTLDGSCGALTCRQSEAGDMAEWLSEAAEKRLPITFDAAGGLGLAIPLPTSSRKLLVALHVFEQVDARALRKLAELFHRDLTNQLELSSLRHENEAFLRQVTNDFEELTFLRSMAELLEISDLSFDFLAMAETVLPTPKPLLDADALVLVSAVTQTERDQPEKVQVGLPTVWTGLRSVPSETCRKLVERYRRECRIQPVVKNSFGHSGESDEFPGVDSFLLVPILSDADSIGWLLALNRNNIQNLNAERVPWDVSYLEFGTHEATLMSSSAAILATHARNVELFREREALLIGMVRALVSAIEAKDDYTHGHSERVALYAKRLAEELGFDAGYCERLYLTGLLHDVGKIGVRDAVLRKPGALTAEEFDEIKQHPDKGWAILHDLEPLNYVLPGVLHHHENHNGRGYPDGLAGDRIPLEGRILAVADAFDAMTSDRPYRAGMPLERAEAILREGAGQQWDPDMIEAFCRAMPDIVAIKRSYAPRAQPQRQIAQTV